MVSISSLLQFMNTLEHLKLDGAKFDLFKDRVHMMFCPNRDAKLYALSASVDWWYLYRQVSSVTRILNSPSEKFPAVEHLTLERRNNMRSVEVHMEIEAHQTRVAQDIYYKTFSNLNTLRVDDEFVEEISRYQRVDDGGHPVELLPELQELADSQAWERQCP
jgi:hypothetical protein